MGCISANSDTWYARARGKGARLQPGGVRVSFASDKYTDSDEARGVQFAVECKVIRAFRRIASLKQGRPKNHERT